MTAIKLCGMTREEDILATNQLMPEYIGFVFWERSHRNLSRERAAELKKLLDPAICCIGVFVNESTEKILSLYNEGIIDGAQLHGSESEEEIRILQKAGMKVIKAFPVKGRESLEAALTSCADHILFDPGKGDGAVFNWQLLKEFPRPCFLAGGLSPDNVAEAIQTLHPFGVDVSSGIETEKRKDFEKMQAFTDKVRNS